MGLNKEVRITCENSLGLEVGRVDVGLQIDVAITYICTSLDGCVYLTMRT